MSRERAPRVLGGDASASFHPLAIVSLASSVLAYGSAFVGSGALIYPAIAVALVAVVSGAIARRAIRRAPATYSGSAIATAGLVSGAAFVLLGVMLVSLARRAGAG